MTQLHLFNPDLDLVMIQIEERFGKGVIKFADHLDSQPTEKEKLEFEVSKLRRKYQEMEGKLSAGQLTRLEYASLVQKMSSIKKQGILVKNKLDGFRNKG